MSHSTPATFYQRTAAWALDALPFQIAFVALLPRAPNLNEISPLTIEQIQHYLYGVFGVGLFVFVLYTIYHLAMEKFFSTTLGKFAVGLEVVYPSLTWSNVVCRFLGCIVSWVALNIGHIMIFQKSFALHDQLTHTQVVYAPHASFGNTPARTAMFHKISFAVGWGWIGMICMLSFASLYHSLSQLFSGVPL